METHRLEWWKKATNHVVGFQFEASSRKRREEYLTQRSFCSLIVTKDIQISDSKLFPEVTVELSVTFVKIWKPGNMLELLFWDRDVHPYRIKYWGAIDVKKKVAFDHNPQLFMLNNKKQSSIYSSNITVVDFFPFYLVILYFEKENKHSWLCQSWLTLINHLSKSLLERRCIAKYC